MKRCKGKISRSSGGSKALSYNFMKNFDIIPCILTELNCSFSVPTYALLIYTNIILYSFYMFRRHAIPRKFYTKILKLDKNIINYKVI